MSAPVLAIENLSIDIPTSAGLLHAGKNISYEVYPGETFAIVGESGAGKSLSSLCVMGIQTRKARVSADRMEFDGIDLRTLQGRPRAALNGARIAMIFQDPMTSLNPGLHHRGSTGRGLCSARAWQLCRWAETRQRALGAGRRQQRRGAAFAVPAPAVWRPAPAGGHCHGDDVPTRSDHRG